MLICAIQESSGGGEDAGGESAQCLQRGSDTGDHLDHEDSDFDDDAVGGVVEDNKNCVAGLWCRAGQRTTLKSRAAPYLGE